VYITVFDSVLDLPIGPDSCFNISSFSSTSRNLATQRHRTKRQEERILGSQDAKWIYGNTSNPIKRPLSLKTQYGSLWTKPKCVTTASGLKLAVRDAKPRGSSSPTRIRICTRKISLGKHSRRQLVDDHSHSYRALQNNIMKGIDLSNKNIIFSCRGTDQGLCTLDAIGQMRHFYGSNTTVSFHNIRFLNGYHRRKGGALMIQDDSIVRMTNCSFWRNRASSGSAMFMNRTNLLVIGEQTNLIENQGTGAPVEMYESRGELRNMILTNNSAKLYVSIYKYLSIVQHAV
jgi:hypothetical protein